MLRLSSSQVGRIADSRAASFARHLAERARARHPAAVSPLSDAALEAGLRAEIDAARAVGLRSAVELERWSDLACIHGFGFSAARPWAAEIVAKGHAPAQTLAALEDTALFAGTPLAGSGR